MTERRTTTHREQTKVEDCRVFVELHRVPLETDLGQARAAAFLDGHAAGYDAALTLAAPLAEALEVFLSRTGGATAKCEPVHDPGQNRHLFGICQTHAERLPCLIEQTRAALAAYHAAIGGAP